MNTTELLEPVHVLLDPEIVPSVPTLADTAAVFVPPPSMPI